VARWHEPTAGFDAERSGWIGHNNMAIVPAGTAGKVDAYANGLTQLILDISSYFAP
jgi:hypothetical protein